MKWIQRCVGLKLIMKLILQTAAREKGIVERFTELIYSMRKQTTHSSMLQTSHHAMFQIFRRRQSQKEEAPGESRTAVFSRSWASWGSRDMLGSGSSQSHCHRWGSSLLCPLSTQSWVTWPRRGTECCNPVKGENWYLFQLQASGNATKLPTTYAHQQ